MQLTQIVSKGYGRSGKHLAISYWQVTCSGGSGGDEQI
jgi:hypothetical protein